VTVVVLGFNKPDINYRIGIYVRQSRDDNDENLDTIETQKRLLMDFAVKHNLGTIYKTYVDDNVSGASFERFALDELKKDVLACNINLVILKDLSRLGRNNAKTLLFLDFLEEYGVRVITSDGRYDSLKDNDTVGIDTWFNE
jgi:DNA invertase Pin-like site-specific DNA recombinase